MTARPLPLALLVGLALGSATLAPAALAQDRTSDADPRPAAQRADVLVLNDGRRLVGEVVAEDDRLVSFRVDGVTRAYPRDRVTAVERHAADAPTSMPAPVDRADRADRDDTAEKPRKKSDEGAARSDVPPLSAPARAWLGTLVARSAEADPQVQRSLAAAMHALGPAAVAPLREAAAGADGATRLFLDRVAGAIEDGARRRRRPSDAARPTPPSGMRGDRAQQMRSTLIEELSVTPDQQPAFERALDDAQQRQRELARSVRDGRLERDAARERLTAVRTDLLATLKDILDPAQQALYEQMSAAYYEKLAKKVQAKKKPAKAPQ